MSELYHRFNPLGNYLQNNCIFFVCPASRWQSALLTLGYCFWICWKSVQKANVFIFALPARKACLSSTYKMTQWHANFVPSVSLTTTPTGSLIPNGLHLVHWVFIISIGLFDTLGYWFPLGLMLDSCCLAATLVRILAERGEGEPAPYRSRLRRHHKNFKNFFIK